MRLETILIMKRDNIDINFEDIDTNKDMMKLVKCSEHTGPVILATRACFRHFLSGENPF